MIGESRSRLQEEEEESRSSGRRRGGGVVPDDLVPDYSGGEGDVVAATGPAFLGVEERWERRAEEGVSEMIQALFSSTFHPAQSSLPPPPFCSPALGRGL